MKDARALRVVASLLLGVLVLATTADAEAQRRRRRRAPEPREGRLVVMVPAPLHDSEILVDEESVGYAPIEPITLSVGSHTVRVRRPGYTEFDSVVEITGGQDTEVLVEMIALAMVLTVRSEPDESRVFVDGTFRGTTPIELELIEGDHELRITAPLYRETTRSVSAVAGQTDALDITLEPVPEDELHPRALEWYEEPLTWILVGGGVLVLGGLAITLAIVLNQDPLTDHCNPSEGDNQCLIYLSPDDFMNAGWTF